VPSHRPLIGLTGRGRNASQVAGLPTAWADVGVEIHFTAYAAKIADAGGLPVMVTSAAPVDALADQLAGLLFTGGSDIDPSRYGAEPDPELGLIQAERDEFELRLLQAAVDRGRPVFGICRGLQLINVWAGGTLHQHVPEHDGIQHPPDSRVHPVGVDRSTTFGQRYPDTIAVNTYHHQTVECLGDGLVAVGWSDDGVIEIIEHRDHRIAAVQWHPELLDDLDPGFSWLVEHARPG
jgi:putative glutamine amidotransferase